MDGATLPRLEAIVVPERERESVGDRREVHGERRRRPQAHREHVRHRYEPKRHRAHAEPGALALDVALGLRDLDRDLRRNVLRRRRERAAERGKGLGVVGVEGERTAELADGLGPLVLAREVHAARGVIAAHRAAELLIPVAVEEALEDLGEGARGGEPAVGLARGRPHAGGGELGRDRELLEARARRVGVAHQRRPDALYDRPLAVQRLEREHLVEHRAERVDVGRGRRGEAAELLGRHVSRRTEHGAGHGRLRVASVDTPARRWLVDGRGRGVVDAEDLGDAPVEDVHLAVRAEHDVVGLEVTMHDAPVVREVDGEADARERGEQTALRDARGRVRFGAASRGEHLAQALAAHALHREEERPARIDADVVDRHDARMLELALDERLAQEAPGIAACAAHHLERDVSPDALVAAQPHLSHAPAPEQRLVAVALGERFARARARELDELNRLRRVRRDARGHLLGVERHGRERSKCPSPHAYMAMAAADRAATKRGRALRARAGAEW